MQELISHERYSFRFIASEKAGHLVFYDRLHNSFIQATLQEGDPAITMQNKKGITSIHFGCNGDLVAAGFASKESSRAVAVRFDQEKMTLEITGKATRMGPEVVLFSTKLE